jgi:tRNA A58 N-methylase Trm61
MTVEMDGMRERNWRFDDDVDHLVRIRNLNKQISTEIRYGVILKDIKQSWRAISKVETHVSKI